MVWPCRARAGSCNGRSVRTAYPILILIVRSTRANGSALTFLRPDLIERRAGVTTGQRVRQSNSTEKVPLVSGCLARVLLAVACLAGWHDVGRRVSSASGKWDH